MSNRVVVRSDADNHVLFSLYKTYYTYVPTGDQAYLEHRHTELEVSCILSGRGIYSCRGVDYTFSTGDVFFHCGNDIHYFRTIDPRDESPSLLAIRFDPRLIWVPSGEWSSRQYSKLFTGANPISRRIPSGSASAAVICQLLEEMFQECRDHEPEYELIVKSKLMAMLAQMVRHYHRELASIDDDPTGQHHLEQMDRSMNYILGHLGDPLTLQDLAREACMSRSYYSAVFKSLNGVSVWNYIIAQRINLAQFKLETTDEPITRICEECGFTGITNFNRAFKRITGKTPREYRNFAWDLKNTDKQEKERERYVHLI